MIDSERRERGIPISAKGNGVYFASRAASALPSGALRGGEALPARGFRLECLLVGSDRTGGTRKKAQGIEGVPKDIKHRPPSR